MRDFFIPYGCRALQHTKGDVCCVVLVIKKKEVYLVGDEKKKTSRGMVK
jgi:hypothetical protein